MEKLEREVLVCALQQKTYIPALTQAEIANEHSLRCMGIATRDTPNQPCGYAHRIGYVRNHVLYRLKVRYGPTKGATLTLPDVFILTHERFRALSCRKIGSAEQV